jgi:ATP/maltotriose-dependent transcriptional regulator MalT
MTSRFGYAINMLGMFRWQQGELDEAVALYNDARDRAVHTATRSSPRSPRRTSASIANIRGDFARALQFYQASLVDYRSMGPSA